MSKKVCVIGQGYVGLPLALAAAKAGFEVIGVDSNSEKISLIVILNYVLWSKIREGDLPCAAGPDLGRHGLFLKVPVVQKHPS